MIVLVIILSLVIPQIVSILPQEYRGNSTNSIITYFKNEFASKNEDKKNPYKEALKGSFSIKQSGYSDSSTILGGSISINHKEVFKVISDKPYYLRGKVMDLYTGKSWIKSDEKIMRKGDVDAT